MEKTNIAEFLKHCPSGMELDCAMYEDVYFDYVDDLNIIHCYIQQETHKTSITFNQHGTPNSDIKSKCVIYPKGKTTWEGFIPPFKDGDIVFYNDTIAIFKEWGDETLFRTYVTKYLCCDFMIDKNVPLFGKSVRKEIRFASEEEKQKLFNAIKENGYRWNAERKTLEKLSPFNAGDVLVSSWGNIVLLSHIDNTQVIYYHCILDPWDGFRIVEGTSCGVGMVPNCKLATEEQRNKLFDRLQKSGYKYNPQTNKLERLIVPKFKVGDKIKLKGEDEFGIITQVADCFYIINCKNHTHYWSIIKQDDWELVPVVPKFKVGDRIKLKNTPTNNILTVTKTNDDGSLNVNMYSWVIEYELQDEYELVLNNQPKFKVGDKIKKKGDTRLITINDVRDDYYIIEILDYFGNCYITAKLSFSNQCDYELAV
jgi:hypothetical protein